MKKTLLSLLAAVSLVAVMASCGTTSETKNTAEKVKAPEPFVAVATENGIEITGIVPKGANQVRFFRNDSTSNEKFMCGNFAYWPGKGDGTEKTFVDYFVNPGQEYEYEVQVIINNNWNSPKKYAVSPVTNGEGGKGEMVSLDPSKVVVDAYSETVSGIAPEPGFILEGARDYTGINAWTLKYGICFYDEVPHWSRIVNDGVLDLSIFKKKPGFEDITKFKVTISSSQYIRDAENGININYLGRQQVLFDGSNF